VLFLSNTHTTQYYTDSGRKVFSGGGITPDIVVKPKKFSKLMDQLLRKFIFFNFAKKYEAIGKSASTGNHLIKLSKDFQIDDSILKNFIEFITSEKITYTNEEFENDKQAIIREIAREIRLALWGAEEAYKFYLKDDDGVLQALKHFDEATALYENKKLNKITNKSTGDIK
jgi:carboxyl-terminal processing protease